MNAVTNPLLIGETPIRQAGIAASYAVGSALERTRPTMTWHIDSTNGRPVIRWVMLPERSSIAIDEH
jgi:hypothetical protein